jgi:hypothetical protein
MLRGKNIFNSDALRICTLIDRGVRAAGEVDDIHVEIP